MPRFLFIIILLLLNSNFRLQAGPVFVQHSGTRHVVHSAQISPVLAMLPTIDTSTNTQKADGKKKDKKRKEKDEEKEPLESGWRGSAALTISLVGVMLSFVVDPIYTIFAIPSILLGISGLRKYRRNGGVAAAGLIIGGLLGLVGLWLFFGGIIVLPL
jgi:hypothetical protein